MQNGMVPYPHVAVKNQEQYLSCGSPSLAARCPASHEAHSLKHQCQEEESPPHLAKKEGIFQVR